MSALIEMLISHQGFLKESHFTVYRLLICRRKVNHAITKSDPVKAQPFILNDKTKFLTGRQKTIAYIWFLSSVRGDTLRKLESTSIAYQGASPDYRSHFIEIRIDADKVSLVIGRRIRLYCSCNTEPTGRLTFNKLTTTLNPFNLCPVHTLPRLTLPISKREIDDLTAALGINPHSFRRAFALACRSLAEANSNMLAASRDNVEFSDCKRHITARLIAYHAGWEAKATKLADYSDDFSQLIHCESNFPSLMPLIRACKCCPFYPFVKDEPSLTEFKFKSQKSKLKQIEEKAKQDMLTVKRESAEAYKRELECWLAAGSAAIIDPDAVGTEKERETLMNSLEKAVKRQTKFENNINNFDCLNLENDTFSSDEEQ